MTSTLVRDSSVGDQWISQMLQMNQPKWVIDKDGNNTGNVTILGRLSYPYLLAKSKKKVKDPQTGREIEVEGSYNTSLLCVPNMDTTVLNEAYNLRLSSDCKDFYNAQAQQYVGLHSPFRDQVEKTVGKNTKGYTPGGLLLTLSSNFAPLVVDRNNNPIVDPKRVYAGAWAIISANTYSYGIKSNQPKKGVGFGLIAVMIVADDDHLDAGAPVVDPRVQFGGVSVTSPVTQPSAMFGQQQPVPAMAPGLNSSFVTPAAPPAFNNTQAPDIGAVVPELKSCWQCHQNMPVSMTTCPHCGMVQA